MDKKVSMSFMKSPVRFWAMVSLCCLVMAGIGVLFIASSQWWFDYKRIADYPELSSPRTLSARMEIQRRELEAYSVQADTLQKLITFLVGLSSFYAVVLGISSYLTAQNFIDRSKENANRSEELLEGLESRLPMFHDFGRSVDRVVNRLARLLPNADVREKYYERLKEQEKQQILYYEKSVAFFEYLDFSYSGERVSEIYRGLGKFYSARFGVHRSELAERQAALSALQFVDWRDGLCKMAERARFYCDRAVQASPTNFAAKNDMGFALQDVADLEVNALKRQEILSESEMLYIESMRLEPSQQCAHYNLARFLSLRGDFVQAEQLLTKALRNDKWQIDASPDRLFHILYNRACYRSQLGALSEASSSPETELTLKANLALKDLEEACTHIPDVKRASMAPDLKPGGDLAWLVRRLPDEVRSIKAINTLLAPSTPPE